jgi:hypothetical protein
VDYTRDVDLVVQRVITTARTAISTSSTAIGFALNGCWRPEKFYITVGTTERFLFRTFLLLLLHILDWLVISVHSLISTVESSRYPKLSQIWTGHIQCLVPASTRAVSLERLPQARAPLSTGLKSRVTRGTPLIRFDQL